MSLRSARKLLRDSQKCAFPEPALETRHSRKRRSWGNPATTHNAGLVPSLGAFLAVKKSPQLTIISSGAGSSLGSWVLLKNHIHKKWIPSKISVIINTTAVIEKLEAKRFNYQASRNVSTTSSHVLPF